MSTELLLPRLDRDLRSRGLTLVRAMPRDTGHALLEVRDQAGVSMAGQLFADPARARRVAAGTAPGSGLVSTVGELAVVQRDGADRRIGAAGPAAEPGARLVAHRPERRAVIEQRRGSATVYVKVVRPGRLDAVPWVSEHLHRAGVRVPQVLAHDSTSLTMAALPGATLHAVLGTPQTSTTAAYRAGRAVGRAIRRLHDVPVPGSGPVRHDHAAEVEVTRRWIGLARAYGVLPSVPTQLGASAGSLTEASEPVLLHRDLHDKQVVIDGSDVGLLDLDLLAVGDPALDVANLLVHLELRVGQGHTSAALARSCGTGLLRGYRISEAVHRRLPVYAQLTRLRLLAVYAFRPAGRKAARQVLTEPWRW
ncbi:phosphotransferase [Ruania alba]|uniref:phosphotransferase n=1 Tax=Ruania alba TaxID=648782 RepID=UPI001113D1A1|nr:phosphotransferase [Ruania alba]